MKKWITTKNAINTVILVLSILFWIILLLNPGNIMSVKHCHVTLEGPSPDSLQMLLDMNPFSGLMIGWTVMVFAMMLPKLAMPIQNIYETSFKHNRFFIAFLFVLGYAIIWIAVGVLMNIAIIGLNLLMPKSFFPAIMVGLIAIIWQFSPIKQKYLNRGHNHTILAAFGWASYRDALHFGIMHGIFCVGAGWALMLFPMLLPQGHNLAMFLVTFIMISEHMEHPKLPRWHFSLRLKLLKILIAQTKIRIKQNSMT
ncbi:DUF2182 domain-containing protein [Flavobacterium polysaccharolyticum]|uniref:DUF2182 domain-containing protein n=1 Tax=Flavobacterium polysaccharolyticum TaxID=3133148 RepID=A0ABU9NU42_9FLAO